MKYLIDKEKFLKEYKMLAMSRFNDGREPSVSYKEFKNVLSKHTKDLVEEHQYLSGMDHDRISIRNELIVELRES